MINRGNHSKSPRKAVLAKKAKAPGQEVFSSSDISKAARIMSPVKREETQWQNSQMDVLLAFTLLNFTEKIK